MARNCSNSNSDLFLLGGRLSATRWTSKPKAVKMRVASIVVNLTKSLPSVWAITCFGGKAAPLIRTKYFPKGFGTMSRMALATASAERWYLEPPSWNRLPSFTIKYY